MSDTRNWGLASCEAPSLSAYYAGCRCDECREFRRLKDKRYQLEKLRGTNNTLVDAGRARERLLRLQSWGYTDREIGRLGVNARTVHRIRSGKTKTILKSTEDRIMAIGGSRRPSDCQLLPSDEVVGKVMSWRARGMTNPAISKLTGVNLKTVERLSLHSPKRVTARVARQLLSHADEVEGVLACDGESGTWSKHLSDWEVEEAVAEVRCGVTTKELGERYGVTARTVRNAITNYERKGPS